MLREIYCRDNTDPKFKEELLETNSKIETVLNKIRMILFTDQGDVLGEPELGMNLEEYLFETSFDEQDIKNKFNSQIAQFIPELDEFDITLDVSYETDGVQNFVYLYILINQEVHLGIAL